MLLKNLDTTRGLVNGSRGVLIGFVEDNVDHNGAWADVSPRSLWPVVRFTNGLEIAVYPDVWQIEQQRAVLAKRVQVPLMLAWYAFCLCCCGLLLACSARRIDCCR